jgi:hypothetical protein
MDRYTHKGWFGICPVYIANPYHECPTLTPRAWWAAPLMWVSIKLQETGIAICSYMDPEWEPVWKIRLTGTFDETKA